MLVVAGEGGVDFEGFAVESDGVVVARKWIGGFCTPLHSRHDMTVDRWLQGRAWRKVGDVAGGADGAEVEGGGGFADGLVGFGVLGEGDEGAVGAEDAGLFAGDLGDGVAEVVLMVEGDVGDDGEEGVDDVGGVESASEAYFEDGDVDRALASSDPFSSEVEEGEGGEDLEEAGRVG